MPAIILRSSQNDLQSPCDHHGDHAPICLQSSAITLCSIPLIPWADRSPALGLEACAGLDPKKGRLGKQAHQASRIDNGKTSASAGSIMQAGGNRPTELLPLSLGSVPWLQMLAGDAAMGGKRVPCASQPSTAPGKKPRKPFRHKASADHRSLSKQHREDNYGRAVATFEPLVGRKGTRGRCAARGQNSAATRWAGKRPREWVPAPTIPSDRYHRPLCKLSRPLPKHCCLSATKTGALKFWVAFPENTPGAVLRRPSGGPAGLTHAIFGTGPVPNHRGAGKTHQRVPYSVCDPGLPDE